MTTGEMPLMESQLAAVTRKAFRRELEEGGLPGVLAVPAGRHEQEQLLERIDRLHEQSARFGRRRVELVEPDGTLSYATVTIDAGLDELRRALVARMTSRTVADVATELEQMLDDGGPGAEDGSLRRLVGRLKTAQQINDEQQGRESEKIRHDSDLMRLKADLADRRRDRWFTRQTIAALVGALLLLGFGTVLTVTMFQGRTPSDIVSNAFLLILGFFFGQGTRGGGEGD
ncbi:hypothetical protein ACIQBJ_15540 [Kitasatospora sp. NPDC088391]|uniref:hypothetical protein n=1 Tax=Kitasatospora sp. NPDC088391 TaxID=3364074 RepID=UPI0037F81961